MLFRCLEGLKTSDLPSSETSRKTSILKGCVNVCISWGWAYVFFVVVMTCVGVLCCDNGTERKKSLKSTCLVDTGSCFLRGKVAGARSWLLKLSIHLHVVLRNRRTKQLQGVVLNLYAPCILYIGQTYRYSPE